MNKDKAIQLLERLQEPEPYEPMLTKDAYDAIQMAIDALSADGDTISREAAIEVIDSFNVFESRSDQIKLEQMIGELPPAQPEPSQLGTNLAEVSTDCISRQAAIERATKEHDFFRGAVTVSDKARRDELLNVMCWLGELPPAQPEQRTGKWERHYSRPNVYADLCWHCSACGYHHADNWTNKFRYCPNCGARMNQSNKTCDCYSDGRCLGTKEIDPCSCSGNKSKCDFYEHVRQEGARHERSD